MPNERLDELENMTPEGRIAKRRIRGARSAKSLFDRLKKNFEETAQNRAKIKGLIDGNAPYNPGQLRRMGQSWRANVNYREAEAITEEAQSDYLELISEVPTLIDVQLLDVEDPNDATDWAEIIAQEYTRTMMEWSGFFYNMMMKAAEMVRFGLGVIFWEDEWDWRFSSVQNGSVLYPKKSKVMTDGFKMVMIRHELSLERIFEIVENKDQAFSKEGWNVSVVKDVAGKYFKRKLGTARTDEYQLSEWESVQQALKNNDIGNMETDLEDLRIVHILTKERSNKITHQIIPEDDEIIPKSDKKEGFLFEFHERFDAMKHVFLPFFYSFGEGMARSSKGLGHKVYPMIELSNRFLNTLNDGAMMAASLLLQPASGQSRNAARLMRIGPVTIVPEGFTAVQSNLTPQMSQIVGVRTIQQQLMNNNQGVFKRGQEVPDAPDKTAREATLQAGERRRFELKQLILYFIQLDQLHGETFRRLTNRDYPQHVGGYSEARAFIKRCTDRKVPKEFLNPDKLIIKSVRTVGRESAAARRSTSNEILNTLPMLDERGRMNAKRDWYADRVGWDRVDRYVPEQDRNKIPTSEHSLATLETNDLSEGRSVPVGVDQPHALHLKIHLSAGAQVAAQYEQAPDTLDPVATAAYLEQLVVHAGAHVQFMAQDPSRREEVRAFDGIVDQIASTLTKVTGDVNRAQQQQLQQQQAQMELLSQAQQMTEDRDLQSKLAEIDRNFQIEMFRQTQIAGIRQQKADHAMALKERMTNAAIAREARKEAS